MSSSQSYTSVSTATTVIPVRRPRETCSSSPLAARRLHDRVQRSQSLSPVRAPTLMPVRRCRVPDETLNPSKEASYEANHVDKGIHDETKEVEARPPRPPRVPTPYPRSKYESRTSPARLECVSAGAGLEAGTQVERAASVSHENGHGKGKGKEPARAETKHVKPEFHTLLQNTPRGKHVVSYGSPAERKGKQRQRKDSISATSLHPGFQGERSVPPYPYPYSYAGIRDSPLYRGPKELRHLAHANTFLSARHSPEATSLAERVSSPFPDHDHIFLFPPYPTVRSPLHQATRSVSPQSEGSFWRLPEYTGYTPSPCPRPPRFRAGFSSSLSEAGEVWWNPVVRFGSEGSHVGEDMGPEEVQEGRMYLRRGARTVLRRVRTWVGKMSRRRTSQNETWEVNANDYEEIAVGGQQRRSGFRKIRNGIKSLGVKVSAGRVGRMFGRLGAV